MELEEDICVWRDDDGVVHLRGEWPEYSQFEVMALCWADPGMVTIEGVIRLSLSDKSATYKIVGIKDDKLIGELIEAQ